MIMVHPRFRPDRGNKRLGTERDVWLALRRLGYVVEVVGLDQNMSEFEGQLKRFKPQIVFNLLEEYRGEAVFDFHLVAYLEALGIAYTGCNPRGLILSRNKFLVGQLAQSLGIRVPRGTLWGREKKRIFELSYPLFVKLNREHASLGIRNSNRVRNLEELKTTCARLKRDFAREILIQEFIAGEDVSVGAWGNQVIKVFSPRKLSLGGHDRISTEKVKFNVDFQRRNSVRSVEYKSSLQLRREIQAAAECLFRELDLSGYARFDFRIDAKKNASYLIDVNPNPNLAKKEDFAVSLAGLGISYMEAIEHILKLGRNYRPRI
jgi:D-alanine-D-alanine ligase